MSRAPRRSVPTLLAAAGLASLALALHGCREEPLPAPPPPPPAVLVPPLHDAQEGEELVMRGAFGETWIWRVRSTTDETVEVEFVAHPVDPADGVRTKTLVWHRNGFGLDEAMVIRRIARDRIEVAGRSWDCWRVHGHSRQGQRFFWVTDELPVHGTLKMAVANEKGAPEEVSAAYYLPPR